MDQTSAVQNAIALALKDAETLRDDLAAGIQGQVRPSHNDAHHDRIAAVIDNLRVALKHIDGPSGSKDGR